MPRKPSQKKVKEKLLNIGGEVMLRQGYNYSGIEAVLEKAGVPRGSFYYYFKSKEDFGLQVIEQYARQVGSDVDQFLNDQTLSPLTRLRKYFEIMCEKFERDRCRGGCLVGNLSQELSDQSDIFRETLDSILSAMSTRFKSCLKQAQAYKEIPSDLNVEDLADFVLNSWEGAILRMKVTKNTAALRMFIDTIFDRVLGNRIS